MIFSLPDLSTFVCTKKLQDKLVDPTFPKPKRKLFLEIILSSKILMKTQQIFNHDCEHVRLEMNDLSGVIV